MLSSTEIRSIIDSPAGFRNGRLKIEQERRYAEPHDDLQAKVSVACGALESAEQMKAMMMWPRRGGSYDGGLSGGDLRRAADATHPTP